VTTAVLLTCHGTVDRIEDIPAFLQNIRRGRPTPQAIVDEVAHRFTKIGGSPLMRITGEQARALEEKIGMPVRVAGRLWAPFPAEVIGEMVREGVTTLISLPLAPQSVDVYQAGVRAAASAHPELELRLAPAWGTEPALIEAFVETIDEALARFPEEERAKVPVILSAHSLPQRLIDAGDPYEKQFRAMAAEVAVKVVARGNPVRIAFQSQGMDGGAWLGPDLPKTFAELAAGGAKSALVAPIGFLSEHVETLYDLDIEAPNLARAAGLERFERAPAVNARPRLVEALAQVARRTS
jgi:ferrochelatase